MVTVASAAQFIVGVNAGQATFSENFDDALVYGGKVAFVSREGIMIEGTLNYAEVDSNTSGVDSFTMVPALVNLNYKTKFKFLQPYIGIRGGLTVLSSVYDTPALTYGAKAGTFIQLGKETRLFFEASQLFIDASDDINIEPLEFSMGIAVAIGGGKGKSKYKQEPLEFKPVRKPGGRKQRPRGPKNPRGY